MAGFEDGDFRGWTTQGRASSLVVICGDGAAPEGNCYARLSTDGTVPSDVPTRVFRSDFTIPAAGYNGMYEVSFWHMFDAEDYLPYNDYLRVSVLNATDGVVLGSVTTDVAAVGTFGSTDWSLYALEIDVPAGTAGLVIQVEAVVSNVLDDVLDSFGFVDGFALRTIIA